MTTTIKTDRSGRTWRRVAASPVVELWKADDSAKLAHGWGVCVPGDEPDHATFQTTSDEDIAWDWYYQAAYTPDETALLEAMSRLHVDLESEIAILEGQIARGAEIRGDMKMVDAHLKEALRCIEWISAHVGETD